MLKMSGGTAGEWEKIFLSDILNLHADGERPLRVNIHQQHLFALHSQTDAQIFTGGGLGCAAFLVYDGDCCCFLCDNITPPSVRHAQSRGSFCSDSKGSSLWGR